MSAKLLNVYVEENQDLEKQIGCMTGIFQMFDRHRLLTGRRLTRDSHKRLPSSGRSLSTGSNHRKECSPSSQQIISECNPRKSLNENRRASTETSKPSLSSSLPFPSSLEHSKTSNFRGIVKDSINGETRSLSVKTTSSEEVKEDRKLKHRDSPRPILPQDLNASPQVMGRFKESHEIARVSCDGREITRTKSTKLRELPRLSLDSRDSLWNSNFDPNPKEANKCPNQRVPSVVAKLMGLEAMSSSAPQVHTGNNEVNNFFHGNNKKNHTLRTDRISKTPILKQTESVYSQIERRLKELDFQESNKDLRALKHVLDTMQANGGMETTKLKKNLNLSSAHAQATPRALGSPIVIMKPSKSINRVEELEGLSGLRKLRTNALSSRKQVRDSSSEKRTGDIITPVMQRSPRPQQSTRERSASQVKTSSPRAQQRKMEVEKKPKPPTRRQVVDSISPRIKSKVKENQIQKKSQQDKEGDMINVSLVTKVDAADRNDSCSMKLEPIQFQQEVSTMEPPIVPSDQPSPISVLDASSFYHDEELSPSPVKRISTELEGEDDDIQKSSENRMISISQSNAEMDSSEVIGNIKNLVQKFSQMSSTCDTENQESVLDYLSEILTASGIQPEALGSQSVEEKLSLTRSSREKLHLDVVQEILVQKLESLSHGPQSCLLLRTRKLGGQFLLGELCSEIETLLAERPRDNEAMSGKDLLSRPEGWEEFGVEVPGLVLEIERLIFKDLVDDIVSDTSFLGKKTTPPRRQLFN